MSGYTTYSFKVDGGLSVSSRARTCEQARARLLETWPRSEIELIGEDLPSANRTLPAPKTSGARPIIAKMAPSAPKQADYADAINAALKDELESSTQD